MFKHLIVIEPLGLLYGSAGKFLSPENLVGRSGTSFPPSAATLSGIFAANLSREKIENLQLAGPFWAWNRNPQNFYVPTPFNCLVKDGEIQHIMEWHCLVKDGEIQPIRKNLKWQVKNQEEWKKPPDDKYDKGTWIAISDWQKLRDRQNFSVEKEGIWKFIPHLHPRLQEEQRRVVDPEEEPERGSLFLENGVQLNPDACLIYLSNTEISDGWYRFGGEGHLVDLHCCKNIGQTITDLLNEDLGRSFALITPAIWGSQRLSYRAPQRDDQGEPSWPDNTICAMLTERPTPTRYRLGNSPLPRAGEAKTLSRGRYAIPAGTVYVLEKAIGNWQSWPGDWFPREGVSFKRWGCGLALPL